MSRTAIPNTRRETPNSGRPTGNRMMVMQSTTATSPRTAATIHRRAPATPRRILITTSHYVGESTERTQVDVKILRRQPVPPVQILHRFLRTTHWPRTPCVLRGPLAVGSLLGRLDE